MEERRREEGGGAALGESMRMMEVVGAIQSRCPTVAVTQRASKRGVIVIAANSRCSEKFWRF
jgi:hypothetical protein